jgi:hypothetical protein
MKKIFENSELNKIIIDESIIDSLSWVNNYQDLEVKIDWCGQEDLMGEIDFINSQSLLHFEFVTSFESHLKFKEATMGGLEITTFSFKLIGNKWEIIFDFKFYPIGQIRFICNNLKFIIMDNIKT